MLLTGDAGQGEGAECLLVTTFWTRGPRLADNFILINQLHMTVVGVVCLEIQPGTLTLGPGGDAVSATSTINL